MALEQDLTSLVQANDGLTGLIQNKLIQNDARIQQGEALVDNYVLNANKEMPHYRLSKNQVVDGTSGNVPDHWISGDNVTYTVVQDVISGRQWSDRTVEEQALLTAMGRENAVYMYRNFKIWRMDWTSAAHTHTLYQTVNAANAITVAAMTKVLSGDITGYWAEGATNEWTLSGYNYHPTIHRFHAIHPHRQTASGSMLFALPAAITGFLPLEAKLWGHFPYIGDTLND